MRAWWTVLVAAGCRGGDPPPKPPPCQATLADTIERMVAYAPRDPAPAAARAAVRGLELRAALIASCTADDWSPQALHCFDGATMLADVLACTRKLTVEQSEAVHAKIDRVVAPPADPTPPVPVTAEAGPPPPTPAGPQKPPHGQAAPAAPHPAPPPEYCADLVVDPKDRGCRVAYCKRHPSDLRCDLVE